MDKKRVYVRLTTPQQRQRLFEVWQETGQVSAACREARVSRGVFYYWKSRFDAGGFAALEEPRSHAVHHHPHAVDEATAQRVIDLRTQHPDWGKRRIADELRQEHEWNRVVSPNTVRRILATAGLWPTGGAGEKRGA